MSRVNFMTRVAGKAGYPPWQSAFTPAALRHAWMAVRANGGTAGADGETVERFEKQLDRHLEELRAELLALSYRPKRVTQVLVPKPNKEWRPITLWSLRDRVAQRAVHAYLEPVFERRFLPCSYGFRPGRQTRHAAEAIHRARQEGAVWVLDADIKDCFGQMKSGLVLEQLVRWETPEPMRVLIERWLRAGVWNASKRGTVAGASQGGVISPLLCNVYLHPFDCAMQRRGRWLIRYADDFVVLAKDEWSIRQAQTQATAELSRVGLTIHPQKTRITSYDEGFQFVGWFFVRGEMFELK